MGFFSRLLGRTDRRSRAVSQPPAGALLDRIMPEFAIVDVETTGLSPRANRILELAVLRVDAHGTVVDEWVSRFNPQGPVGATHIHGITAADVANAPLFHELAPEIAHRISGLPLVAHNARFDLAFMRSEFSHAGWDLPWLNSFCTLQGSHHYLPRLDRRRLADCCWHAGVRLDDAHSALGDARATAGLLRFYLTGSHGLDVHPELRSVRAGDRRTASMTEPERAPSQRRTQPAPLNSRNIRYTPPRPAQPPLTRQLTALSLADVLDEGAPDGTLAYLEVLLDALEDGEISEEESGELGDLAAAFELESASIQTAHRAFILALAHRAVDDGHVSQDERTQLHTIAEMLGVPKRIVLDVIKHADDARAVRLGAGLRPLPSDWAHGEPLRVGDKVAFTGCDDAQRERLEHRAEALGVRVVGNVSGRTAMLVTDGNFAGTKLDKALQIGTRVEHPDVFEVLLAHLQPAAVTASASPITFASTEAVPAPPRADDIEPPAAPITGPRYSPGEIRSWAAENGYVVGVRGRLPREVIEAFEGAMST